jgi:hypothetical protein
MEATVIKVTDDIFQELLRIQGAVVEAYGIHAVTLAIMKIIDRKAEHHAVTLTDITMARHWANCSDAAVALEAVTLREFGE